MLHRDEIIKSFIQKKDPRSDWENKIILDVLQEEDSFSATGLVKTINAKFECEPPLFTYNQIYAHLLGLLQDNIIEVNTINKRYSIKPEYISVREHVKYLPVSNYCVGLFGLSIVCLLAASALDVMVDKASLLVLSGGLYLLGQFLGSEFDFEERKETAVIANGVKLFHQKIVAFAAKPE